MPRISVAQTIDAPLRKVWASWNALGDTDKFNPGLRQSRLLAESAATTAEFDMTFEPKPGVMRRMMVPTMKFIKRRTIAGILQGNADSVRNQMMAVVA